MALIPLEGLRAPSKKTSLLGGVAQILIFPRPSPCLADVGLFVRPKSQHYGLAGPLMQMIQINFCPIWLRPFVIQHSLKNGQLVVWIHLWTYWSFSLW